jgi:hypothetical protein
MVCARGRFGSIRFCLLRLAILVPLVAVAPGQSTAAEPWVGEMGVTQTTAEIMARGVDFKRNGRLPFKTPKQRPRGRVNFENLLLSPDSADATNSAPANDVVAEGFSSSLSFTGATLADTDAFPPDSMGAVGPAQYVVAVNGRLRSFNKHTGVADGVLDVNPDVFFEVAMTPPATNNFTSDPRVRYDRLSGRWFLIIIDVPGRSGALANRIMIAVSDSGVITPSTVWTFFQFQHDLVAPQSSADNGKFADYPTLGIDAHALYIGVNIFGTRGVGSFANTTGFVVRKSSLLGPGPIIATAFRKLVGPGTQGGPYTPQGVDNYDPNATEGYFIGVDAAFYGRLQVRRVSDPGGTPTISDDLTLSVPATGNTINVPHLGNTNGANGYLDGLDFRLIAAHIRNGRLWTAANIAVNNVGSPTGTDTRVGIRWYEISIGPGQTPSLLQAGTLFEPSPSNTADQRSYWMGSVMVSGQGHALMGFSVAGANEHANAGYAVRLAGDPVATFRAPVLYTASTSSYNPARNPGGANGRRWGDYSYTSLDPDDDMTMWTIQEWCHASNSYAVQVVRVLAPPPATPVSASPATLIAGQSNVSVTVTGTIVDGSGFFDPGPGFSNRIAAAVGGAGVVVNSVTYNNPTNVTLSVTVSLSASEGARTITVTNPDGQSVTSASPLLTIQESTANRRPSLAAIPNRTVLETTLLSLAANASDPDGQTLAFTLDPAAPEGAVVDPMTGAFSWTPSEAQGPSTNDFVVTVFDSGVPPLSATQSFTVIVLESNTPPSIATVPNQTTHAGLSIVLTNIASDSDVPSNTWTFALDPGAPLGATVDPLSGVFAWMPSDASVGTNEITIRATDDGDPPSDATTTFSVIVESRPAIEQIVTADSNVAITWSAIAGFHYRLQYKINLNDNVWMDLPEVTAPGPSATTQDVLSQSGQRFYRVHVMPQ